MIDRRMRLGILGTGNIAQQFCDGVRGARRIALSAVASRTMATAQAFADKHSIPARHVHGSYPALLDDRDVDAIYVALPNSLHHEWTMRALRAGKHVLCEKPLAVTAAQGEEMFRAARETGRCLVEAFMYVSHPQTAAIIEQVRRGAIGELRLIRTSFCYRTQRTEGNIRFDPELAGGAVMDVGCYCVHFARMIAGGEPIAIQASAKRHESGIDELTAGVLGFPNGVVSTFSCGMTTQCDNTAQVCGSDGYLEIPWPWKPQKTATFTLAHSAPPKQDRIGAGPSPRQSFTVTAPGELYEMEADEFAATVLEGAAPRVTEADSIGNLRALDAIRKQIGMDY